MPSGRKPGSAELLRELFVLVASGTQTVGAGAHAIVIIEQFPGDNQHTFYLPSFRYASTSVRISQTGAPQGVGGWQDVVCGLFSRRSNDADGNNQTEIYVQMSNFGGAPADVEYRVYRIRGLKGEAIIRGSL